MESARAGAAGRHVRDSVPPRIQNRGSADRLSRAHRHDDAAPLLEHDLDAAALVARAPRMKRAAAAILLAFLFALQAWAVVRLATGEPDIDEIETLHASWLMAKGAQLYVSFFEHHSPLLYATVQRVPSADLAVLFRRARLPSGGLVVVAFWIAGVVRASGAPSVPPKAHRRRAPLQAFIGAAVAIALTAAAVFVMSRIAPLDRTWFFMVDFNRALARLTQASADVRGQFKGSFDFAPSLLQPLVALIAFIMVAARAKKFEERRIVFFFLALAGASLLELRFTFPYPILWPHYYAMWGLAAAALIALVPASLSPDAVRTAATIVVLIVITAYVVAAGSLESPNPGPYWVSQRFLTRNLKPGETVWLYMKRHPVTARDANYYWFNFGGTVPVARQLAGSRFLPRTDNLPLCAIARGARLSLRYIAERRHFPEDEARCFDQLLAAQRIRATAVPGVFEVVY